MIDHEKNLAPGHCIDETGKVVCPCANWCRTNIPTYIIADLLAGRPIPHAPLCDGAGNPTRGLLDAGAE